MGSFPVKVINTSTYFASEFTNTSSGNNMGVFLSKFFSNKKFRMYCLSRLSCVFPTVYFEASQYRDESGVNTSSATYNFPSASVPNSNLVSAKIRPLDKAYSAALV
eukprot:Lithocolla_globosa_v1_NODE_10815_length_563_cov_4.653543.p2 type:complete len:106 gc:universal NODE_10815_length_563_cov_4.653543:58-375(+)